MEVFPERDGNFLLALLTLLVLLAVRMEVFPERDGNGDVMGNVSVGIQEESEWRSSLKGMETYLV